MNAQNIISKRLKEVLDKRGMSAAELAREADIKTSFIYDVLSGKSLNPSTITLARVANVLDVPLAYLAGGQDVPPEKRIFASPANMPPEEYARVPRIEADVSAGAGAVVTSEEESECYYFRRTWIRDRLSANPQDLRMLFVRGDSMEPTLHDGDIILIDTRKNLPSPPGIFVLFDGFGLVAKRLEFLDHADTAALRIISDNPQYTSYERLVAETRIIGRVVWFAREL